MSDDFSRAQAFIPHGEKVRAWPLADALGLLGMCRFRLGLVEEEHLPEDDEEKKRQKRRHSGASHGATLLADIKRTYGHNFLTVDKALPFLEEKAAQERALLKARIQSYREDA